MSDEVPFEKGKKVKKLKKKKVKEIIFRGKLTTVIAKEIAEAIKLGCSIDTAAAFVGVHATTLRDWLQKGNRAIENDSNDPIDKVYKNFVLRVKRAVAEAQIIDIKRIDEAAKHGQWQAAAWKLSRGPLSRSEWFEKKRTEHTGEDGGPIEHNVNSTSDLDSILVCLPLEIRKKILELIDQTKDLPEGPKKQERIASIIASYTNPEQVIEGKVVEKLEDKSEEL